jgi:hypothetical protein
MDHWPGGVVLSDSQSKWGEEKEDRPHFLPSLHDPENVVCPYFLALIGVSVRRTLHSLIAVKVSRRLFAIPLLYTAQCLIVELKSWFYTEREGVFVAQMATQTGLLSVGSPAVNAISRI